MSTETPQLERSPSAGRWMTGPQVLFMLVGLLIGTDARGLGDDCSVLFLDRAADFGLSFTHDPGARGKKFLPETMGAGAAWLDYDGDGWLDLYLVQSGEFPPQLKGDGDNGASDRLYRNEGPTGDGFRFSDVTEAAGIDESGYGQGVLAIDVDGDRDTDLVLTHYGRVVLLENRGGRFHSRDLDEAGLIPSWASSATAADVDGDGDLDLYVARYLTFDPARQPVCRAQHEGGSTVSDQQPLEYCDPSVFSGQRDLFFQNLAADGNSDFALASAATGLELAPGEIVGKGLGALFVDINGDFRPDLYVANDITPNHLFLNIGMQGSPRFQDESLFSGAAVNQAGRAEAGMGLAVVDDNADGRPDLLVTNFDVETNTLYRNQGDGFFSDQSVASGFGLPSFNALGFGLIAEDFDLDGWVDTYSANGHIFEQPQRKNIAYRQPDALLRGGSRGFVAAECATDSAVPRVSRGAASADFDLDGDMDLVVTHVADSVVLLEARREDESSPWIGIDLVGEEANGAAIGAVVTLRLSDDSEVTVAGNPSGGHVRRSDRWVVAGGSYLSSSSQQQRFGQGQNEQAQSVEVVWPSGRAVRIMNPPANKILRWLESNKAATGGAN